MMREKDKPVLLLEVLGEEGAVVWQEVEANTVSMLVMWQLEDREVPEEGTRQLPGEMGLAEGLEVHEEGVEVFDELSLCNYESIPHIQIFWHSNIPAMTDPKSPSMTGGKHMSGGYYLHKRRSRDHLQDRESCDYISQEE